MDAQPNNFKKSPADMAHRQIIDNPFIDFVERNNLGGGAAFFSAPDEEIVDSGVAVKGVSGKNERHYYCPTVLITSETWQDVAA